MTIKKPEVRLLEHNKGLSKYTRTFLPWEVLYYETFFCRVCAEKRERYLKSGKGYKLKKMIIKHRKELS